MPYGKLDDALNGHPKIDAALDANELRGLAAIGLWTLCIAHCSKQLTDGAVSARSVRSIAPEHGDELTRVLLEVGLFDPADTGVLVHDYLDHNPSREEVEQRRADDKARAKAGRDKQKRERQERAAREAGEDTFLGSPVGRRGGRRTNVPSDVPGASNGTFGGPGPIPSHPSPSLPPLPPEGGNDLPPVPKRPSGKRVRETARFEQQVADYAAARFPEVDPASAVGYVSAAITRTKQPTHEAIADFVRQHTDAQTRSTTP